MTVDVKKLRKKISKMKSYLFWKFVEEGWILFCSVGRLWFSSGSNYSEGRWVLYEGERENIHIIPRESWQSVQLYWFLTSPDSGRGEKWSSYLIYMNSWGGKGSLSPEVPHDPTSASVSGQAGGRLSDALPRFRISFKITTSAKNLRAASPDRIGLASACSPPSWGGAEDFSVGQSQVGVMP